MTNGARRAPRASTELPTLHAVTDDHVIAEEGWVARATEVMEAGGGYVAVHLRGPRTPGSVLFELARTLAPQAVRTGARLLVNDRVDVALTVGADGAHLGGRSLPPEVTRPLLGEQALVGLSTHGPGEIRAAVSAPVDYLFFGAVFPTASHEGVPGTGIGGLRDAIGAAGTVPVIGIGGVGPGSAAEVMAAGAYGIAAIRGVWNDPSPASAVERYMSVIGGEDR